MPYQILPPTQGGTGLNSYTTGDILYASATNVLSKLAAGSNGDVLTLASGVPSWAAGGGGGGIGGSTGATDNAILIADGTGGSTLQAATSFTISGDQLLAPAGTTMLPSYSFSDSPTDGIAWFGQGDWTLVADTVSVIELASNQIAYNVLNRIGAGLTIGTVSVSTNYTVLGTDVYVGVDTSGGAITITLDANNVFAGGRVWIIQDTAGNALVNNITVDTAGSETINGNATASIITNYGVLRIIYTNNFFII